MSPLESRLSEILETARKADRAICDAAAKRGGFRMSIPPHADDTDMLVTKLTREHIPFLLTQLERMRRALEELKVWPQSYPCRSCDEGHEYADCTCFDSMARDKEVREIAMEALAGEQGGSDG